MRTRLASRDRRLVAATALVAAAALTLAGCGSDSSTDQATPSEQTTSASSSPAALAQALTPGETEEPAAPEAKPADAGPKVGDAADLAENRHVVTAIRVGEHQGKDRIVFELGGDGTPGYTVDYVDAPAQQGSGNPVEVAGDSFLQVMIGNQTLPGDGLTEVPVGTVSADEASGVAGVAFAGQFEAQAQAVIGLKGTGRAFTAFVLQNPTRVVVDVEK